MSGSQDSRRSAVRDEWEQRRLAWGRDQSDKLVLNHGIAREHFGDEAVEKARSAAWEVVHQRCVEHDADLCYGDMDAILATAFVALLGRLDDA